MTTGGKIKRTYNEDSVIHCHGGLNCQLTEEEIRPSNDKVKWETLIT